MTNHYVYKPDFCSPAAGWDRAIVRHWSEDNGEGQVEKNVRNSRHQLLQMMPNFPGLPALNAWLEQHCMELWQKTQHGTLPGTIADVRAEERAALMPLT